MGISSGANFLGALKLLENADDDAVVVTVFCDDYLSPGVRLTGFDVFRRVCVTCWEPSESLVAPT